MTIIANHVHLMPKTDGDSPEGDADMVIKHMDFCGIDKAVIFAPFARQMDGDAEKANMWALEEVEKHKDRFLPAGTLSPIADDSVSLLDKVYSAGVRLIKIHPSVDNHDIADPAAADFYCRAEELGVALDYHTGTHRTRLSYATPYKFDDLAWDYPELKLVFEHIGGRAYCEMFVATLFNIPDRVFGGVTSILAGDKNSPWYIGIEKFQVFVKMVGAEKFIFGMDFPWNPPECTRDEIKLIQSMDISGEDKDKILGGNLCDLLKI